MPRIVDHDARRAEIIRAVWSVISRRGFDAVTMRDLATEAGYANGALARYFPDKDSLLRAAFRRAFDATDERAAAAIGDRGGLEALRLLLLEIMPLDDVRLREARVVLGFWDYAAGDPELVSFFQTAMEEWRERSRTYLRQAEAAREIPPGQSHDRIVDTMLTFGMGLQITASFIPRHTGPDRQLAMLEDFLDGVRDGRFPEHPHPDGAVSTDRTSP